MAMSADVLCGLCEDQDITKYADQWCPECEEGLCIGCLKFHKSSKATKHHKVISVENFKKLPTSISSIVHHCKEHDRRYQNYCPHHESLCCPVCIATIHNKCNDLLVIDDFIKNANTSSLESMEESIEFLKWILQMLLKENDTTLNANKTFKNDFLQNVKKVREKINAHFDKLEQEIAQEMLVVEKHIKDQIDYLSKNLKQRAQAIKELENDVVAVKEYASDLQTCFGIISLKTRVEAVENYIKFLFDDGQLNQILLKCSIDEKIPADILSVKTFGSVATNEIPSTVDFNLQGKRRAQITSEPTPKVPKHVDEINVTVKCKFDIPIGKTSHMITGCVFGPNSEIMLIDRSNSTLLIFDENEMLKTINLPPFGPIDVTLVDDKTICVSYYEGNRLELINPYSNETIQIIKTTGQCCGVTSEHGTLFWYERGIGIQMMQQSSDEITLLVKANNNSYWCYLAVFDGKIYQTNGLQHIVKCFKRDGQKIWEFRDEQIVTYPRSIAIDGDSNVYVANFHKGLVVLSPNGKICRKIFGFLDGLCDIYALSFDRKRNQLLVSKHMEKVYIFNAS